MTIGARVGTGLVLALAALAGFSAARSVRSAEPPWRARYERVLDEARDRSRVALVRELDLRPSPATWAEAWTVESEHYAVTLMQSRAVGLQLAGALDTMYALFEKLLGTELRPTRRFRIEIHPDLAAYNAFGEANGAEHSSFYGSFFAPRVGGGVVAACFDRNPTLLRMWLTHGALHQYLAAAFPAAPPTWIDEGLASYFSLHWDPAYGVAELERLRAIRGAGGPFALRDLLQAPVARYTDRAHDRLIQLGMLFNYLLHYREDTRTKAPENAPFAEYLGLVLRGEDVREHPVHELLNDRLDQLERDFAAARFAR